jgi:protein O-GlcNAc transferase
MCSVVQIEEALAQDRHEEAWQMCRELLQRDPDDAAVLRLSARAGQRSGKIEDAYADLLIAGGVSSDPADAAFLRELECEMLGQQAQGLGERQRYQDAEQTFARAEALATHVPELYSAWGHMEMARGRLDEAIRLFRQASYMQRPCRIAHSNLLLAMTHSDHVDAQTLFDEHLAWAARYTPREIRMTAPELPEPNPDRPLRVGFVSPDLRSHPVAHFLLPILQNHDRSQIHITCYDDRPAPPGDRFTPLLRAAADDWLCSVQLTAADLFERIREDRIDILFDLSVHSDRNRLPMFAARPAAIQMSWLGYVGTTGVSCIDYRITDSVVDPPGMSEMYSTEKLLRMPEVLWCYAPHPDAPPVREQKRDDDGTVRFGTATRLAKVTPTTLDLWCRVLAQVEDAMLILSDHPLAESSTRDEWLAKFTSRGIDPARIQLVPGRQTVQYLELLGAIDIGLDTFPFNGGTTMCNMLSMSTPIVALRGRPGTGRVSASICGAAGLQDFIAEDADDWVARNVALARDVGRRNQLRRTLRQQFLASPVCDGPRFTRNFEQTLRKIWRERCAEV